MDLKRGIDTDLMAAISSPVFYPIMLVYIDWPSAPVYVHSGVGNITYDSQTWVGVGNFGEVSIPDEAQGLTPTSANLTLYGVPSDIFGYLEDEIRNRTGRVLWGATTTRAGNVLIGAPVELFSGYIDADALPVRQVEQDGRIVQVLDYRLTLGSGPGSRSVASIHHSYEDQIGKYPGDTAGRHVQLARSKAIKRTWPE
jgi:hypothetical protein